MAKVELSTLFSISASTGWIALYKWTERTVTRTDDRTIQAVIGKPGTRGAYYMIRFSMPCTGPGTIDTPGAVTDGAGNVTVDKLWMYARFDTSTVTVAIAKSFVSMDEARSIPRFRVR